MGIKGLLQFLKEQQRIENLKTYRGCTAAVDVYCWLHKAVYGCVEQIAIAGNDQGQYISYCEKYWNTLRSFGIKPILVFDGQNLPAKAHTEKERRDRRKANRDKANALLAEGKKSEARQYFERCIDITPHMAHKVIVAAVSQGIDCIVAPYEADAQLAYLSLTGIAQLIISEDSDLLCFGCERVMFKLDLNGNGVVQERSHLLENKSFRKRFTFEHFVKMCILSGCDYLPSLPGIGLAKACKFMSQQQFSADTAGMLRRLPLSIKVPAGAVTDEYIQQFINAVMTFKHQVVFDPVSRQRKPMTPHTDTCCGLSEHPQDMAFAGRYFPAQQALQMALGNINLHTMDTLLPEIDPDLLLSRENGRLSVWHPEYKPKGQWDRDDPRAIDRQTHSTKERSALVPVERVMRKRTLSQSESQDIVDALTSDDTTTHNATDSVEPEATQSKVEGYSTISVTPKPNKVCRGENTTPTSEVANEEEDWQNLLDGPSTPPKLTPSSKANRFMKDKLRGIYHMDGEQQETPNVTVTSRYFGSSQQQDEVSESKDSGIAASESASSSQSPSASPSEPLTQFSPSHSSTQYKTESPTKYKAKFLGALDELDSNPSPQVKAFRWSKSSLHESVAALNSDLSPSLSQQFKSPLLKSKLAQVTSAAHNEEGAGETPPVQAKLNPFKQRSTISPTIRSAVAANPFKVSSSPGKKDKSVFGKAVSDKQTEQQSDPFSAKQLTRIGSKSERPPVTQKLSTFKLNKHSPVKGDKSKPKPAPSQSSQKENLLASSPKDKLCTPPRTSAKVLGPLRTHGTDTDSGYTEEDVEVSECKDSAEMSSVEISSFNGIKPNTVEKWVVDVPALTDTSTKENCAITNDGKKSSAVSAFLSKFTKTKTEKMASSKARLTSKSLDNSELVVDLT